MTKQAYNNVGRIHVRGRFGFARNYGLGKGCIGFQYFLLELASKANKPCQLVQPERLVFTSGLTDP